MSYENSNSILYWLKLYHKNTLNCFNVYNDASELIAFIPSQDSDFFESKLGIGNPKFIENLSISNCEVVFSKYSHLLIDPKNTNTLKGYWVERFSKIISKNVYKSLGFENILFKSPESVIRNLVCHFDINYGKILNLGVGSTLIQELTHDSSTIFNLDLIKIPNLKENQLFLVGDVYNLPLKKASFDAVIALFLLEHTPTLKRVISNIYEILNDKGRFLFSIPFIFFENENNIEFSLNPPFFHFKLFTLNPMEKEHWITSLDELDFIVASKGFKKEKIVYFNENGTLFNRDSSTLNSVRELYAVCSYNKP